MVYAGRTLAEIARLDDWQLRSVFGRKRDEMGRLIRHDPDLPNYVRATMNSDGMRKVTRPVPFSKMYRDVKRGQGLNPSQTEEAWERYKDKNPRLKLVRDD